MPNPNTNTEEDQTRGLYTRYSISKVNGDPVDPDGEYFVLRLDWGGSDHQHVSAGRRAVLEYANFCGNPMLARDLRELYGDFIPPQSEEPMWDTRPYEPMSDRNSERWEAAENALSETLLLLERGGEIKSAHETHQRWDEDDDLAQAIYDAMEACAKAQREKCYKAARQVLIERQVSVVTRSRVQNAILNAE